MSKAPIEVHIQGEIFWWTFKGGKVLGWIFKHFYEVRVMNAQPLPKDFKVTLND